MVDVFDLPLQRALRMAERSPWTIALAAGPVPAWMDRVAATTVAALATTAFVLLWNVEPSAKGYDTHVQLGMEPCGWPRTLGIPCPTCGCTTAACHLVHGNVLEAFVAQPFGALLALFGLLAGLHAVFGLATRRSFADLLVRLPFWSITFGALVLMLLAWLYKYLVFVP